jgi:hypothetical protein
VEKFSLGGTAEKVAQLTKVAKRKPGSPGYAKAKRKEEQTMSIAQLVEKVDAWARVLKAKEEGSA